MRQPVSDLLSSYQVLHIDLPTHVGDATDWG
jgi:hypothetical protein